MDASVYTYVKVYIYIAVVISTYKKNKLAKITILNTYYA